MSLSSLAVAMLISGGGTTAEMIYKACKGGALAGFAEPRLVVSSRRGAPGIRRLKDAGMDERDIVVVRPRDFPNSEAFGEALIRECESRGVEFIGQYGWLAKTPINVIERFPGMMVNQHPGPLDSGHPDFGGDGMYGLRVHCARIYFVRTVGYGFFTEATAQRVAPEFDRGAVIDRWDISISHYPRETARSLARKLLPLEHLLHIAVVKDFREGNVHETPRRERLVRDDEIFVLEEAKRVAKTLYPHG